MALRLFDELEKQAPAQPALEDLRRYSTSSEDEKLNELDPLHSSGQGETKFDYQDRPHPGQKDSTNGKKSRGFLSKQEAKARRIRKWRQRICVPGRLCCVFSLVVSIIVLAAVGGSGYWAVKRIAVTIDGHSPPWYPSPKGGTVKKWQDSYTKAAAMVAKMNLAEKVNVTTGVGWMNGLCVGNTGPAMNVGFPSLCLQDGPLGIRFADHITATPAGITVGATWNKELMYKRGKLLGLEYKMKGVNVMLGPAVGPIGKFPAGGRVWEGFGSDPVLQGLAAAETIRGVQEEGVMATIKHLIGNEQEHFRQMYEWTSINAISSNIDDRTLHEMYGWPFADSVKAGVAAVMCSYNQVNNSYSCQNSKLMNGFLKDELGFQGFVMSDWGAHHSGVDSAFAGLDMTMPGGGVTYGAHFWGELLTLAVLNGSLPIERLDDMATRIVAAWYQLGQDDTNKWIGRGPNFSSWTKEEIGLIHPGTDDRTTAKVNHFVDAQNTGSFSHGSLARRIAAEGTVLLKNSGGLLPLSRRGWPQAVSVQDDSTKRQYRIAVVGEDAVVPESGPNSCVDRGCNKGTLASGWGSGSVEFPYIVSPLDALQEVFHGDDVELKSYPTNELGGRVSELQEMDLCIVFVNADSGEGYLSWDRVKGDRPDLFLQKNGDKLIKAVSSNCGSKNPDVKASSDSKARGGTIVVIHSVGPVVLEEFIELASVRAVIFANLPGQESGHALTDILLGDVNPSGHLPFTIGKSLADYGPGSQILYNYLGNSPQQDYDDGLFIDYRGFDARGVKPRFPFGYGLSYTTFGLQDLKISTTFSNGQKPESLPGARPANEVEPPRFDSVVPDPAELVFPSDIPKWKYYIYPYIDHVDQVKKGDYPYPDMTPRPLSAAGGGEGGNPALWETIASVEVTVVNTGARDGQPVVQLYVGFPDDVYESFEPIQDEESEEAFEKKESEHEVTDRIVAEETIGGLEKDIDVQARQVGADTNPSDAGSPSEGSLQDTFSNLLKSPFKKNREYIPFPRRVLRGFEKVHTYTQRDGDGSNIFRAREETIEQRDENYKEDRKTITFNLTRRDLSYWSTRKQNWILPDGTFRIEVGFDSRDLKLKGNLF